MSPVADYIFYGGDIITMDESNPSAEALAVKGNLITAVGKLVDVFALAGESTQVIYLNQQTLLPGFIEPHTHAILSVTFHTMFTFIDGYAHKSYDEVKKKMKETISNLDHGEETSPLPWALFFGWDPELIPDLPTLSADFLDREFPKSKVPIVVVGQSGHVAWVNSKVIEEANINKNEEHGGVVVTAADGEPTGQLFEWSLIRYVITHHDKAPNPKGKPHFAEKIKEQWRKYASSGFTTVTEMVYERAKKFDHQLKEVSKSKDCPIRLALYKVVPTKSPDPSKHLCCPSLGEIDGLTDESPEPDEPDFEDSDKLWIAGVKITADGSPHCGTAALREPFLNSNLTKTLGFPEAPCYGRLNFTTDELLKIVKEHHDAGKQIAIHAHGERAIDQVLTVYEQVVKEKDDSRHRIEHLGLATADAIARAAKLNLALSFFVCHLYFYAKVYAEHIFGRERTNRWTPLSEASKHGLRWSIHQDHPAFPGPGPFPMANLKTAVTRTHRDDKETVYGPEHCVSIHEALKAYTINAAWQINKDHELGSLKSTKKADLLILSKNPYKVDPMELESIKVVETFMDGRPTNLSELSKVEIPGEKFLVFGERCPV